LVICKSRKSQFSVDSLEYVENRSGWFRKCQ